MSDTRKMVKETDISPGRTPICRLCLSADANDYVSIYDKHDDVMIIRIIIDCVGIKVRKNDGITQDICNECHSELVLIDKVRKRCIESDKILRDLRTQKLSLKSSAKKVSSFQNDKHCASPNDIVIDSAVVQIAEQEYPNEEFYASKDHSYTYHGEVLLLSGKHEQEEYEIQYLEEAPELSEAEAPDDRGTNQPKQPIHSTSKPSKEVNLHAKSISNDSTPTEIKSNFICCGCPSSQFDSEEQLHAHRDEQHEKYRISDNLIRPFECDTCYQRFLTVKLLTQHQKRPYRERSHVCKSCGLGYFTSSALRRHEKVCNIVENNFSCEVCGKRFRQIITLKNHRKLHVAGKAFSCSVCGKTFKKKFEISIHMVTHTLEQPYPCDHCPARFKRKQALKNHQRHHTNARPYKCDMCEEWFNSFAARKFHRQTVHEGLDPFRCEQCGGSYGRRLRLLQHMKKVHGIDLKKSDAETTN